MPTRTRRTDRSIRQEETPNTAARKTTKGDRRTGGTGNWAKAAEDNNYATNRGGAGREETIQVKTSDSRNPGGERNMPSGKQDKSSIAETTEDGCKAEAATWI